MKKTSNINLSLYDLTDTFDITGPSNSLNANMKIIDEQVNDINNNIKGIDELKKETASLKGAIQEAADELPNEPKHDGGCPA